MSARSGSAPALGTVAVYRARQETVLFITGGAFVAETLSATIQEVPYFKWTGRQADTSAWRRWHRSTQRAGGLEGMRRSWCALLDHHDDARAVRALDAEAQVTRVMRAALPDLAATPARGALRQARARARARRHRTVRRALGERRAGGPSRGHARRAAARARSRSGRRSRDGSVRRSAAGGNRSAVHQPRTFARRAVVREALARAVPVLGDIELFAREVRAQAGCAPGCWR